ncbi:flavodoxin family protein [soil metagenome]
MTEVRKGQFPGKLSRVEFHDRYQQKFHDPRFDPERDAIARLEDIAWSNFSDSRKAPITQKAGPGFKDPDYDLSVEWVAAKAAIDAAQREQSDPASTSRVLVINGSPRNDGSCPGEMSKSHRLAKIAAATLELAALEVDYLDLSEITSEYTKHIHPCKGCASTAMPLCHWPCSCYPNHSLGLVNDWMYELYPRLVRAHGVIIVAPTHWYQSPSVLKSMIDRLVCADGGNPDPSSTHGKKAEEAKAIELAGWDYPKHLADRVFGVIVHGDVAGIESQRRNLSDWLRWMGLIDAGERATIDRYIGYYEPYATSHDTLDKDQPMQDEARLVAKVVGIAVARMRRGELKRPDEGLAPPRAK